MESTPFLTVCGGISSGPGIICDTWYLKSFSRFLCSFYALHTHYYKDITHEHNSATIMLNEKRKKTFVVVFRPNSAYSPAVKGQNCSFFDRSIKLGRVTNLYETNISWYGAMPNFLPEPRNAHVKNMAYKALTWKRGWWKTPIFLPSGTTMPSVLLF